MLAQWWLSRLHSLLKQTHPVWGHTPRMQLATNTWHHAMPAQAALGRSGVSRIAAAGWCSARNQVRLLPHTLKKTGAAQPMDVRAQVHKYTQAVHEGPAKNSRCRQIWKKQ